MAKRKPRPATFGELGVRTTPQCCVLVLPLGPMFSSTGISCTLGPQETRGLHNHLTRVIEYLEQEK